MLSLSPPTQGLLFFGILFRSDLFEVDLFQKKIEDLFGKIISFSPEFNPSANYYSKEMGEASKLKRIFFLTSAPYPREFLLSTKLLSLDWENSWSQDSKRMVNVDIGFLSAENFILATTKNYAHRIYLGQNIFADLTYQCAEGRFQTLPWTYPDFQDQVKVDFLNWCRTFLLMQSKVKTT